MCPDAQYKGGREERVAFICDLMGENTVEEGDGEDRYTSSNEDGIVQVIHKSLVVCNIWKEGVEHSFLRLKWQECCHENLAGGGGRQEGSNNGSGPLPRTTRAQ